MASSPPPASPPPSSSSDVYDKDKLLKTRRGVLGPSLSVSYDDPLVIVRGAGQYLYDADGEQYLDCVNNVCTVGHCHPAVVKPAAAQMATLNTNTRYLHPTVLEYAQTLLAKCPAPLSVCFFVNSGSEANELALRMARTHTKRHRVFALDHAYHGNTDNLVSISPYKFKRGGGFPQKDWVTVLDAPDPYRGRFRGAGSAPEYVAGVEAALEATGDDPPACFIFESVLGCAGQVVMPDGYLDGACKAMRKAGVVCIADEVQVGLGRVGSHFWGFETQGVVPDIVTCGKPSGNGHPIGFVVTTRAIAESFNNGMEFFNTFGGNPVSATVGLAVLRVIEDDGLQQNAERVGRLLLDGFRRLMTKHPVIGDVRGVGLFVGVELVLDHETLEPATEVARDVVNSLRRRNILMSTDGPFSNVLKLKPPLCFSEANALHVVRNVDAVLSQVAPRRTIRSRL